MATAARLTALLSVALAITLVLVSDPGGNGFISLLGWIIVALLATGLIMGHRGGITALAVGFVVRLGLVVAFDLAVVPDMWVQALLLTLSVETASISFTLRVRPVDPLTELVRGVGTALIVGGLVAAMGIVVEGTDAGGILVSIAGVAALVVAAGWVVRTWRRSGLA
ncbi:MAG: hypothetical protein ACFCU2_12815 [Acidimicrobiia bacterium]